MKRTPIAMLPMGPEEERVLLETLRAGQSHAFEALYHRFIGKVFGLCLSVLVDRAAAEDAAQETFLRVFRGIHRFRGESALGTWIHRVAINVCRKELSRRQRAALKTGDHGDGVGDELADAAKTDMPARFDLVALMSDLDPIKRATFYLHHVEEFSAQEIADVLGDTRDAVLKRLQRTRRALVERLRGGHYRSGRGAAAAGATER